MKRILVIGGTGIFGSRIAAHLARKQGLEIVIGSRSLSRAENLARNFMRAGAASAVTGAEFDRNTNPARLLGRIRPWTVIDASGPFQRMDYRMPVAVLEAGSHFIDLADARDYLAGFTDQLHRLAVEKCRSAITGASTTPALSVAAADAMVADWQRVDTIDIAIMPGGQSQVGQAAIAAALSYAGKPVSVWENGRPAVKTGWRHSVYVDVPGLRRRRIALVETSDSGLLGERHHVRDRVRFYAGLESPAEQYGMEVIAGLKSAGFPGDPVLLAGILKSARRFTGLMSSDAGGMLVRAAGVDGSGCFAEARWTVNAYNNNGLHVPTLAACACVKSLLEGRLPRGASLACDVLALSDIEKEMAPYEICTSTTGTRYRKSVFRCILDSGGFDDLPAAVKRFHEADGEPVWRGRADVVIGRNPMAKLISLMVGFPEAGSNQSVEVTVRRQSNDRKGGLVETWIRDFRGRRFRSSLTVDRKGCLSERFGPIAVRLDVAVVGKAIILPASGWTLFGVPMPRYLGPRSKAREHEDEQGRFCFDVRLSHPFCGMIAHYRGWLEPASTEKCDTGDIHHPSGTI